MSLSKDCCSASGNYALFPNSSRRELRYIDRGGPKHPTWATEDAGSPTHVIHYDVFRRLAVAALGGADLRRPCDLGAGCGWHPRKPDVPRLWSRVGRLYPRRIRRTPAAHVRFRFQRYRRSVVCEPLHVRRRLRHGGSTAAQDHPLGVVRNPPVARGHCGRDRAGGDVAAGPPRRRPDGRACIVAAAGAVPDLLRAHVHEPEGCAFRGSYGDPDVGAGADRRGIPEPLAADHSDRRTGSRAVDWHTHSRRSGLGVCAGRLRTVAGRRDPPQRRSRSRPALVACSVRTLAWPDPGLPRNGLDLALVDHATGKSVAGPDVFFAVL